MTFVNDSQLGELSVPVYIPIHPVMPGQNSSSIPHSITQLAKYTNYSFYSSLTKQNELGSDIKFMTSTDDT